VRRRKVGNRRRETGDGKPESGRGVSRRRVLATAAGVAAAVPFVSADPLSALADPTKGKFLTSAEFSLLDELTEIIIPADDHSPGARAAKVAAYIDARLAEAFGEELRTRWRDGLRAVEDLSQSMHGRPFMKTAPAERLAVVKRMAANEKKPERPEEKFFRELKRWTVNTYYTSEIGLKQEMEYKGNTLLQEFSGVDVSLPPPKTIG
jgi:hypothetical protein